MAEDRRAPKHPTVRGLGATSRPPPPPSSVPDVPESWPETRVVPVDDLPPHKGGSLTPSPIITINPPPPIADAEIEPPSSAKPAPAPQRPASAPPRPMTPSTPMTPIPSRPTPKQDVFPVTPMTPMTPITPIPPAPVAAETAQATPEEESIVAAQATEAIVVARSRSRPPPPVRTAAPNNLFDPRLVLLLEPNSPRAAGFRLLRDNLLAKSAPKVIAVSSGGIHEGKTTCAVNLALAFSEKPGKRVLLLDANFFQPTLHRMFHIDLKTPTTTDATWLAPYRIAEVTAGFHVGALVPDPSDPDPQFSSRWFELVVDHVSSGEYDHVVIDCAALDGAPMVTQIVGIADGVLLTVRSGRTSGRALRRVMEQIPQGRGLGVTLMDGQT